MPLSPSKNSFLQLMGVAELRGEGHLSNLGGASDRVLTRSGYLAIYEKGVVLCCVVLCCVVLCCVVLCCAVLFLSPVSAGTDMARQT